MLERYNITQGERCAVASPNAVISTLLGSCVACCFWDAQAGVGGMNHMLLTSDTRLNGGCDLLGVNAMELLINDLLKLGAVRHRLQAKAFGGAQMVSGLSNIGPSNADFVLNFLEREGIECVSKSLGGKNARQIQFTPSTGQARLRTQTKSVFKETAPVGQAAGNGLELF